MSQFHDVVVKALHQTLHPVTPITLPIRKKNLLNKNNHILNELTHVQKKDYKYPKHYSNSMSFLADYLLRTKSTNIQLKTTHTDEWLCFKYIQCGVKDLNSCASKKYHFLLNFPSNDSRNKHVMSLGMRSSLQVIHILA